MSCSFLLRWLTDKEENFLLEIHAVLINGLEVETAKGA